MRNDMIKDMVFDFGWECNTELKVFENIFEIFVKLKAFYEKDGITEMQQSAYEKFVSNKAQYEHVIEKELLCINDSKTEILNRFVPVGVLIQRNGEVALLLDDAEDEDNGLVIVFNSETCIMTQDEYL